VEPALSGAGGRRADPGRRSPAPGHRRGGLHAVDAATGDPCWSLTLDEPTSWLAEIWEYDEAITPFTLVDAALYVTTDTSLLALR